MEQRQNRGFRTYLRLAPSPKVEGQIDLSGFNLQDFLKAAHSVFSPEGDKRRAELGSVVAAPLITIRDRIGYIRGYLQERGRATFITLLGRGRSRIEIVVTFLALLELVKRRFVFARQAALFSDIEIEPSGNWESADNLELDFGE